MLLIYPWVQVRHEALARGAREANRGSRGRSRLRGRAMVGRLPGW